MRLCRWSAVIVRAPSLLQGAHLPAPLPFLTETQPVQVANNGQRKQGQTSDAAGSGGLNRFGKDELSHTGANRKSFPA